MNDNCEYFLSYWMNFSKCNRGVFPLKVEIIFCSKSLFKCIKFVVSDFHYGVFENSSQD